MVEQVREELDKAPDQYRQRFDEIFAEYNGICSQEKGQVIAAGGLHILGTERHESRRIDNQLRGRAGRQGDPGSSRFYLSLGRRFDAHIWRGSNSGHYEPARYGGGRAYRARFGDSSHRERAEES